MNKVVLSAVAASLMIPATFAVPTGEAQARKHAQPTEWRGRDGRMHCRRSDGTTGLVIGAAGGALIGRGIAGRGDRTTGTILGAVGGGLLGRHIDKRSSRCR